MFGAANRDHSVFESPEVFDLSRDNGPAIPFGAGPHFCAGAAVSRVLIAEVALPKLFNAFPNLKLLEPVEWGGWAFRGPLSVHVRRGA
jgi:cytochrome P450